MDNSIQSNRTKPNLKKLNFFEEKKKLLYLVFRLIKPLFKVD